MSERGKISNIYPWRWRDLLVSSRQKDSATRRHNRRVSSARLVTDGAAESWCNWFPFSRAAFRNAQKQIRDPC